MPPLSARSCALPAVSIALVSVPHTRLSMVCSSHLASIYGGPAVRFGTRIALRCVPSLTASVTPRAPVCKAESRRCGAEYRGAMRGEAPPMSNAVRLPLFLADPFCRLRRYVFIALLLAEGMLPGHVRVYHGPPAWTVVDATSLPLDFELLCDASWAFAQVADGPCEWVPSGPGVPRVEALHAPGASGRCPCTQGVGPGWVQGISTAMGLRRMYL